MKNILLLTAIFPILSACAASSPNMCLTFEANMRTLCGQTYTGAVVSDDPQDADWKGETLVLGPVHCDGPRIEMPLAVGADTSRTWILESQAEGLYFHHRHLHSDGTPDDVTGYGGTDPAPARDKAVFPVDAKSIANFRENGLDASVTNIWHFEIAPETQLAYELNREGRHFRAEFDLTSPR